MKLSPFIFKIDLKVSHLFILYIQSNYRRLVTYITGSSRKIAYEIFDNSYKNLGFIVLFL